MNTEPATQDNHPDVKGVLLSDEIEYCVENYDLIRPFEIRNLRPASYDFTIGDVYKKGGREYTLDAQNRTLEIKPHEAVVVSTRESLNMPRFLVGRWNPKVKKIFQGLVWVGGVHIDPGWTGPLWCPVYNLSRETIWLNRGDTFASIDFEKTSEYHEGLSQPYPSGKRPELTHPGSGLEIVRDEVKSFPKRLEMFQTTNFAILAIIVAALSVIAVAPDGKMPNFQYDQLSTGISIGALFLSVMALVASYIRTRRD